MLKLVLTNIMWIFIVIPLSSVGALVLSSPVTAYSMLKVLVDQNKQFLKDRRERT